MVEKRASTSDQRQAKHPSDPKRVARRSRRSRRHCARPRKQAFKGLDKKDQKQMAKLLARIEANLSDVDFVGRAG